VSFNRTCPYCPSRTLTLLGEGEKGRGPAPRLLPYSSSPATTDCELLRDYLGKSLEHKTTLEGDLRVSMTRIAYCFQGRSRGNDEKLLKGASQKGAV
jgi:hypothetical protein